MAEKVRLDILLTGRGLFDSREKARAAVMSGDVYVNGQKEEKPGAGFSADADIEVRERTAFVSRGGLKLMKALDTFAISVEGLRILDGGASTGGFTDCLLRRGAAHVWAVDVGYGQLAWALRNDPRVTCMERFNIRSLTSKHLDSYFADMAVLDLSFISLSLVLPVVRQILHPDAPMVCLVKPQFEAGREKVGKNGVVRDATVHLEVLQGFALSAANAGFGVKDITFSPIKGPKGNIEFLAHLTAGGEEVLSSEVLSRAVRSAHEELI